MSDRGGEGFVRSGSMPALAGFLALTFTVAIVSTFLTTPAIPAWYATLAKPSFNPPNKIFGPVWTLLYALMAIAAWMVWKISDSRSRQIALRCFYVQLLLNFLWSLVFFRLHRIGAAAVEITILWLAIVATMGLFFRLRRAAGWMLVPYLAWVSFASVLNYALFRLN